MHGCEDARSMWESRVVIVWSPFEGGECMASSALLLTSKRGVMSPLASRMRKGKLGLRALNSG